MRRPAAKSKKKHESDSEDDFIVYTDEESGESESEDSGSDSEDESDAESTSQGGRNGRLEVRSGTWHCSCTNVSALTGHGCKRLCVTFKKCKAGIFECCWLCLHKLDSSWQP